jgi:putative hydrolase of the HAD superfamily
MVNQSLLNIYLNTSLSILDFDGCLTVYTKEHLTHCDQKTAEAALEYIETRLGVEAPLSLMEARKLARKSYEKHGWGFAEFCNLYGLNPKGLHEIYHEILEPGTIKEVQVTSEHLRDFPLEFVILSHSHRTWINRVLEKFNLKKFVPDDRIFALEDVDHHLKSNGGDAYRSVLRQCGVSPFRAVMIDDSLPNLESAKKLGIKTIHLSAECFGKPIEDYIDYRAATFSQLYNDLVRTAAFVRRNRKNLCCPVLGS